MSKLLTLAAVAAVVSAIAGCRCPYDKAEDDFAGFLARPEIVSRTGCRAYPAIEGKSRRDLYVANYCQMFANYGDNVDFRLREQAILLDATTRNALYSAAAVPPCRYEQGSRPELEKIVAACRVPGSEQETALNLMRFCRDLHKKRTENQPLSYGGPEELMIERGEILCEELARLVVALAEVAGIPGRVLLHAVGGHYTAELFADGQWRYLDPRMGIYFLKDDGSIASVADLVDDPGIIARQSEKVKKDTVGYTKWELRAWKCRNIYFTPVEMNCFSYYSLADSPRYRYGVLSEEQATRNGLYFYNEFYRKLIAELTPPMPKF